MTSSDHPSFSPFSEMFRFLSIPLLAVCLAGSVNGALTVVAENLPLNATDPNSVHYGVVVGADQLPGGEPYQWSIGQTFLARASGQLYTIEATVDTSAGYIPAYPLMVSVVSLVNGQRGATLASSLVSPSDIPGGPPEYAASGFSIIAQFSEGVLLEEGTQYAIEFSIPTAPAHYVVWGASPLPGSITDRYPDGVSYDPGIEPIDYSNHGDFYFRVTVEVPEPGCVPMVALVGGALLRRRR
jgi:hypothetical protein